jgi:hypothetical protein
MGTSDTHAVRHRQYWVDVTDSGGDASSFDAAPISCLVAPDRGQPS